MHAPGRVRAAYLGPAGTFSEEALIASADADAVEHVPYKTIYDAVLAVRDGDDAVRARDRPEHRHNLAACPWLRAEDREVRALVVFEVVLAAYALDVRFDLRRDA